MAESTVREIITAYQDAWTRKDFSSAADHVTDDTGCQLGAQDAYACAKRLAST